ncbi:MAG: Na/Pi cotransporter family protein [Geminicoccaceae bacterium]|nr:Na/Pi cotransporter family protein [Geminicoccaceae bacterium]
MTATGFLIELLGGIALLLWGVRMVRTGVSRALGSSLHRLLRAAAGNRLSALGAGFLVTVPLQSSTATALIVGAFAERGLIALAAALAVMLGADIGTAVVAQLLAIDLHWLSPISIIVGFGCFVVGPTTRVRQLGRALIGVGLIMLALRLVVASSEPLRTSPALAAVLTALEDDIVFTAALAALLTWLAHSSIAVILTVAGLVGVGVVPPAMALAVVLGANAGGAIAPFVATSASPPPGRRPALGNLVMRGGGAVLGLAALPWLAPLILAHLGSGTGLVLNLHLAFNLLMAILMLPLVGLVARLVTRLLPDRPTAADELLRPRHLDKEALQEPSVALANAAREALRLGDAVEAMLRQTIDAFAPGSTPELVKKIEAEDDVVDALHEAIKLYLTKLSQSELEPEESHRCFEILTFTTNFEHIGDIIDRNLMELATKKLKAGVRFSDEGFAEIERFHARIVASMQMALSLFMRGDLVEARRLIAEKTELREMEAAAAESHLSRVGRRLPQSLQTSSLHIDVIRDLKRIHSHLTAVAYPILERAGELSPTRLRRPADASTSAAESPAAVPGH